MSLCALLASYWHNRGRYAEAARWHRRVLALDEPHDTPLRELCLVGLAFECAVCEQLDEAVAATVEVVELNRRVGDIPRLSLALNGLATWYINGGNLAGAATAAEEAAALARACGDKLALCQALATLSYHADQQGDLELALELATQSLEQAADLGDDELTRWARHNRACALRRAGHLSAAHREMHKSLTAEGDPEDRADLIATAEDYGALLAVIGDYQHAARLLGAAQATRLREGIPLHPTQESEIEAPIAAARTAFTESKWQESFEAGRRTPLEDAIQETRSDTAPT
jgi:tetratricopeptide (TPR) repeat protein